VTLRIRRFAGALVAAFALPLALAACSPAGSANSDNVIRVLAGSEVKDLEPILNDMADETGVTFEFEYIGTLDGTEALLASDDNEWDATWFPSNRYLTLFPEGESMIAQSESIMRSPVALGLQPEKAAELGWSEDAQPTWQEVVDAASSGDLTYGLTSPISSNSGFTTVVQLATALSGTGSVLTTDDIETVAPQLVEFAKGQTLASGSSGWLAEKYAEDVTAADGIFNYESVLEGMDDDLTIIIPSDGVITSDYPLTLLNGADEAKTESFNTAVDYLLSDATQQRIADETHRRTTVTPPSMDATVFELPFPNQLSTVQALLESWLSEVKKPSNMVFAIDTSGSMSEGDRMNELTAALDVLSGADSEGTAGFLRLQPRETITYLEFADQIKSQETYEIPSDPTAYQQTLDEISQHAASYSPGGGTSIYSTVFEAYEIALENSSDGTLTSIVLFTDGENTEGVQSWEFEEEYAQFLEEHPEAANIPVYTVVFGDSSVDEMEQLAALTGGRSFDATSESLAAAFREIRGYL
jgi:Ca-activated chloride channel family protein